MHPIKKYHFLGTTFIFTFAVYSFLMYVRLKNISGRRYAYLVEGERRGGRVRQKTLCYMGSLPAMAVGLSYEDRQRVESRIQREVDWTDISNRIRKIPLTFDELNEIRQRLQLGTVIKLRNTRRPIRKKLGTVSPKKIFRQRVKGELAVLTKLSKIRFESIFLKTGDMEYRMES